METAKQLPWPEDNPKGLHAKYKIREFSHMKHSGFFNGDIPVYKPVPPNSEYFVLRLDEFAKDKIHVNACRKAVLHYAELIKDHLPELSRDLIERYSQPVTPPTS